jgi:hypothetical protein
VLVCPGCGARNDAAARVCEWCGRPFVDERPRFAFAWAVPFAAVGLVILLGLTVMISLLGAMLLPARTGDPPRAAPAVTATVGLPPPVVSAVEPVPATVAPSAAAPSASVSETAEAVSADPTPVPVASAPDPTPVPLEWVQIANTDRQGAFIRREARTGAPGIIALREGTILKIVGSDVLVDGRPWRNVEDARGNRGWIAGAFLEPTSARGF